MSLYLINLVLSYWDLVITNEDAFHSLYIGGSTIFVILATMFYYSFYFFGYMASNREKVNRIRKLYLIVVIGIITGLFISWSI